ncbi:hypothetical protein [Variovorax sp. KK3]|uniref:hypothetical protein n=1 Tax=Variovorax sp. KK3 TaxID=1855728 RepID=UPI00117F8E20|nr:hypothetical protein [Variovorax sp. KK3]
MTTLLRKAGITIGVLLCIVFVVVHQGRQMIESSPVFEASRQALKTQYGTDPAELSLRPFSRFKFAEGGNSGTAEFVLCSDSACYQVNAKKKSGAWEITKAEQR